MNTRDERFANLKKALEDGLSKVIPDALPCLRWVVARHLDWGEVLPSELLWQTLLMFASSCASTHKRS